MVCVGEGYYCVEVVGYFVVVLFYKELGECG